MNVIAIRQREAKYGIRLFAFYDAKRVGPTVHNGKIMVCAPAVQILLKEENASIEQPVLVWLKFSEEAFEPIPMPPFKEAVLQWIEAGIGLANRECRPTPKPKTGTIEMNRGRDKPLYHLVWERWPAWQSAEHREKMKSYTIAVGAHEDLLAAFPAEPAMKGITSKQVTDVCNRLGLPLQVSR